MPPTDEFTDEQAQEIKQQLLEQLVNFPEDKRNEIKKKILSMTTSETEEFVNQNNLMPEQGECIFCSIANNKIPSYKINENKGSVAILEINPLSKGHTLIISKEHFEEAPESSKQLAQETIEKIKSTLNPTQIRTNETKVMNHAAIELIPTYDTPLEKLQKSKASPKDLESLQKQFLELNNKPEIKQEAEKEVSCIACSIIKNPLYQIDENKDNIAVLELTPLSKGHTLVIPRIHAKLESIPSNAFTLAKKISKKIQKKFNPIEIKITSQSISGHAIVEIIPIYGNETQRKRAEPKELEKLQKQLSKKKTKNKKSSSIKKSVKPEQKRNFPELPLIKPRIPK